MSTRKRAGTWQDEVARSFSRLFSRTSSQEKEKEEESAKDSGEEQDKSDKSLSRLFFRSSSQEKKDGSDRIEHGEEQERSHSPSRLFFRKISQESKGGNDNVSPAKGNKEEQDKSKGFSRLFGRTSSQEKEEESDSSRGASEDQYRHEDDDHSNLLMGRHEELLSPEPEQVTLEQTSNPELQNISEPEEEKDGEFTQNSKVLDSEKQSRENFFHFIGNLFHFSPKSSLGNSKQGAGVQEPCKEHEDAGDKNNLDKEDISLEQTLGDHRGTEEASEQSTACHEQEDPGDSGGEIPKELLKRCEDEATNTPKLNGHVQEAPSITYGTYRGSRRIRKLLKRRADVNSPIPEREETPETTSAGDATTENYLMLHECVKMEPIPDRNCDDEIPPSKIHIKSQPKHECLHQNSELNNDDKIIQKAKNSKLASDLEREGKDKLIFPNIVDGDSENRSEIVEGQQTDSKEHEIDVPQLNAKESSESLLSSTGESIEDLQPAFGGSLNISWHLEQNVGNSEDNSKGSTTSKILEPNNDGYNTDVKTKSVDILDTVSHIQPKTNEVSKQPEDLQSEVLQKSTDDDSKTDMDLCPKVAKESVEDCLVEHVHANADISNSKKYETFLVKNNSHSEAKDTSGRTEKIEESTEENTNAANDMQSALEQFPLKMVLNSEDCSTSQIAVEVDLHENKAQKDHSGNLFPTTHITDSSIDKKNFEDFNSTTSDLKPNVEIKSDIIEPNTLLALSSTVTVEPNSIENSLKGERLKLHAEEHSKQPNHEFSSTCLNRIKSESEDIPNLHLQLGETFRTSEGLQQTKNIEHLQTNGNIILENDLQNDDILLYTEPNTKASFQVNNTSLEKKLSQSGDIPELDFQPSQTSPPSTDRKQTENIEHVQTNANIITENDLQKDGKLPLSSTKETLLLKESSDESPLKSGIISMMIENQKPNKHIVSNVSDGIQTEVEEPSKVNMCLEPNSDIHISKVDNDFLVPTFSEFVSGEGLPDTSHSSNLTDENNVNVEKPDGAVKEQNIKFAVFHDLEDITPQNCLNDISSLHDHGAVTSRNISFDNGIECRSPSTATISDSSSYADCIDVQFDSPNDSGIVSSQAYTPEEHILFKTLPSEILIKTTPYLFSADQNSEEDSEPNPESSLNIQNVPVLQDSEALIKHVPEEERESVVDGCTSNSLSDVSNKISTPDKLNLNSDVYVAKVSVKTVNVEEVKISPYVVCSDIISVAKIQSPTYTKEVICIPNLSPTPLQPENTFQVLHRIQDDDDFITNSGLPNDRGDLTVNNCEKHQKNYLETDELPSLKKDKDVTRTNVIDSTNNDNTDSISQYTCIEKKLTKITDKSPDVLIENLKNNNINDSTSDNIINATLQGHKSEKDLANEALMSSDSLEGLGESLSELNPDSKMNHREKLSDLLLHSALIHDVTDTNEIISSCSTTGKISLPDKNHSESSNELFEQKANEIIFSVLHSAIDELQNINQKRINIMSVDNLTLTDIKHVKETLGEKHRNLQDYPAEVLDECPGKSSDHILMEDTDLIMSMAVGIVSDVISSSQEFVASNIIPNVQSKDLTTGEATQKKTTKDFNGLSLDNQNGIVDDATNSNHLVSPSGCDNVNHLPSREINSNVLHITTEGSQNGDCIQAVEPKSANESGPLVTKDVSENNVDRAIENNDLTKTEEDLSFSRVSLKADTDNLINESYSNGDLVLDDMYSARQMESISLETEGSMEDLISNKIHEEGSNSSEFSDFLQFSLYNSRYVEISESDDESTDEEKDNSSEQASGNDSFLSVQSRRVRIYPLSLSPIYEDDSACEDTLSNNSSPIHNEGAMAGNNGHDHTSILSLLQSVSDRLKEADLEEASQEEGFSSQSNEASERLDKEGCGKLEDIISPSKTSLDGPSTLDDEKAPSAKRSGLFITKSIADKPNPVVSRQSFLLNLSAHANIYGAKPSTESSAAPSVKSDTSVSSIDKSNQNQSPDLSPSMATANLEPVLPIQRSALDDKLRVSPKSVFYQYFHDAQNYVSSTEDNGSSAQEKLEEPKKTEAEMDPADSDSLKYNPRPGKVILSDIIDQENKIELKADILDATSWVFPNGVNIRVIRGCWILYEKPHFEGQAHVLEEGEAVLRHLWDLPGAKTKLDKITIGSVKRVVKDYLPEVVISSLHDVSDSPIYIRTEVPLLENLVGRHPRSIIVSSGVWLAYTEPQYNGAVTVLEEGCELPQIQDSGLKSMRPLKMGGLKVQLPSDPKIIVYEKPHFQGWSREITEHVSSIGTHACEGENSATQDIGSMKVIGGIWVGYENERYKGHQYLLEEGDYEDWHAWGGYNNTLQSIRYLQADFLESSVTLYETEEEDGKQINLFNQAIPDLELAGYNTRTQCIHVKKGMWVAYQQKHFCGEQYILEKGRYKTHMDWGGSSNTIMSIRPVLLEPLGRNDPKHLIKAYTSAEFQGETKDFTQGVSDFISFMPLSFKVLRGCWLLCYKTDTCDNLCVLEEGHFPDLASCGCPTAEIKYIKPIDYVFAEPSISLFALDSCEGRELHFEEAVTSILSKDLHFYVQSVSVRRGLWIAFEGANFLGRQMLLDPQQILNWSQFSGWKAIGSLRPLKQPSVYFMVKNRDKDKYLTVSGKVADSRATFVTVSPRNGQTTQIWYFCRGFLKSKANDLCLDVIGGKNIPGSKVSLWAEHGKTRQKWKANKDGTISSLISDDLVLDLRGGNYYDQNYTVVNKVQESAVTQKWDIEIL